MLDHDEKIARVSHSLASAGQGCVMELETLLAELSVGDKYGQSVPEGALYQCDEALFRRGLCPYFFMYLTHTSSVHNTVLALNQKHVTADCMLRYHFAVCVRPVPEARW